MQLLGFSGAAVAAGGFAPLAEEEPVYFKGESPEEKAAEAAKHSFAAGGTIAMFVSTT
jgi:hypothetical protein